MIFDWNWFFSSLAQSVAAIVGIFAAFIITKIINNQKEYSQQSSSIKEILNESERLLGRANNRYFDWYNKRIREEQFMKLSERLEDETDYKQPEEYYNEMKFSPFDSKDSLIKSISVVIEREINKRVQETIILAPGTIQGKLKTRSYSSLLFPPALHDKLTAERELIDELVVDIKYNIKCINSFLEEIQSNPQSSKLISYSILSVLVLFYIGVIYPLSFMPMPTSATPSLSFFAFFEILFSFKGIILSIITIIFTSIMIVFYNINNKLIYPEESISSLKYYTDIANYSEYLKEGM